MKTSAPGNRSPQPQKKKLEKEDSAKETAEKETDEETIVEEERCMDAEDGEEDAPRHHSTAKQSADYYKAHQEDGKPKDAPAEADVEPQTKKGRLSFEDEKGGIVRGMGMGVKKVAKKGGGHRHRVCPSESTSGRKGQFRCGSCSQVGRSRRTPAPLCQRQEKAQRQICQSREKRWRGSEIQPSEILRERGLQGRKCSRTAAEKRNSPSRHRLPQEVKQKQSARSFTRKNSIRMLMQPPSAARKPELLPASRRQRQPTPLRRKRKRRCRRSSCRTKLCGSVLVWASCW